MAKVRDSRGQTGSISRNIASNPSGVLCTGAARGPASAGSCSGSALLRRAKANSPAALWPLLVFRRRWRLPA